jgi:hypothetical protein
LNTLLIDFQSIEANFSTGCEKSWPKQKRPGAIDGCS